MYFSVEARHSLDGMSSLVPHVPNPSFWKKYYTDQAKGKMYARATPSHRTVGQRGKGAKKEVTGIFKTISPVQQTYERAQSQIKRRIEEVGGVKRRKKIKASAVGKGVIQSKGTGSVRKCGKKKRNNNNKTTKSKIKSKRRLQEQRDIFS